MEFHPYQLAIAPKWADLLRDFLIIKEDHELDNVISKYSPKCSCQYNIFSDSLVITVLQPNLIYINSTNEFQTAFTVKVPMPFFKPPEKVKSGLSKLLSHLWLYVREMNKRIEIGFITTPHHRELLNKIKTGTESENFLVDIASIPDCIIAKMYPGLSDEQRLKYIKNYGWQTSDFSYYEHKYIDLIFSHI